MVGALNAVEVKAMLQREREGGKGSKSGKSTDAARRVQRDRVGV